MVAGCGATCVKYTFFTFNFLIFLCGAGLLGVSLWARFDNNFQAKIEDAQRKSNSGVAPIFVSNTYIALYVIAAVGGFLMLCGFLGCCGAVAESPCLLATFFSIILTLFLVEIAGAIYIFVKRDTMQDELSKWFSVTFVEPATRDNEMKRQLSVIEDNMLCCGVNGCGTSAKSQPSNFGNPECCQRIGLKYLNAPDCPTDIYNGIKEHYLIVAIVAACLVLLEIFAMIFSCILCNAIRNSEYSSY